MKRPGILTRGWWLDAPSDAGPRRRAVDSQPRLSEAATVLSSMYGAPNTERLQPTFQSYAGDGYAGNSVVFSAILARLSLFSEAEFKFQNLADKHLFGDPALALLEEPWPGGTTGELLVRMEQDGSMAGNAFIRDVQALGEHQLERLRPDRVIIVSEIRLDLMGRPYRVVVGYAYDRYGDGSAVELYDVDEVAHWSPVTDPLANFRGMSWLTPVVREIAGDQGMTDYKIKYLENAATPNLLVKYQIKLRRKTIEEILEGLASRHGGLDNAFKALIFDQGADATVVGNSFEQMSFTSVQAAGENRVLMAAGVPGIVVGSKEGLEAATYSNYGQAMRRFADVTMRPLWRSACGALQKLASPPPGSRLWWDPASIAALQQGEQERAATFQTDAQTAQLLIQAGYLPDTVGSAVTAHDLTLARHSGGIPTTLYSGGGLGDPAAAGAEQARALVEMIQKVYLGVDKVISADEARAILNRAGAGLSPAMPAAAAGGSGNGRVPAAAMNGAGQ